MISEHTLLQNALTDSRHVATTRHRCMTYSNMGMSNHNYTSQLRNYTEKSHSVHQITIKFLLIVLILLISRVAT